MQINRSTNMNSGVYLLTCKPTRDKYIGSSGNVFKRWQDLISPARLKSESSLRDLTPKMKKLFIKYDPTDFTFQIIELTKNTKEREAYWIEKLKPSLNRNMPTRLPSKDEVEKQSVWEQEMESLDEWWASKGFCTKRYARWLYEEDIRLSMLNFCKEMGYDITPSLLREKPCPINAKYNFCRDEEIKKRTDGFLRKYHPSFYSTSNDEA